MSSGIYVNTDAKVRSKQSQNAINKTDLISTRCEIKLRNEMRNTPKSSVEEGNKQIINDFNEHGFIFGSNPRNTVPDHSSHRNENESDNNISSCSTLDIDNKVHVSHHDLEGQIRDLTQKLRQVEKERNEFKKRLAEAVEERERSYRRLEVISSAHESRITEMHCVIAELSKKLRSKQESTIVEENEPEESEFSFHEGSAYNSEMNLTNPDAECQTEPLDIELPSDSQVINDTVVKTQVEALQEEILHLKAQIALLQSQIANNIDSSTEKIHKENNELALEGSHESCEEEEKSNYHYQERNLKEQLCKASNEEINLDSFIQHPAQKCIKINNTHFSKDINQCNIKNLNTEVPVPKMAERVKLRRTVEEYHITGADIVNNGLRNTEIVEHLVSMMQCEDVVNNMLDPSQLQAELQRLQRRVEHFKLRNSILSLTLDECKEHCEHLYLLCGKYESNAVALQMALNCSDRAIEAYDVMLALLESKLAILKEKTPSSQDSRRAVEAVARHLLDRLESEKNLNENSLGPWQNTVCINSTHLSEPWTQEDDNRLRNHVSKLKGRRSAVQNTVVNLESPFSSNFEKIRIALEMNRDVRSDNHQMDLEMAVLMQELMSLREDMIETKHKLELTEKEKNLALEKVFVLEEALTQLQSQLADSEAINFLTTKDRSSYSEAEHTAIIERQLVEALTRESQLKSRIQTLIGSASVRKCSDEKYAQVQNNVAELQKANINLSQSLEQCKRKYQSKIKRLEQKILQLTIEANQQIKSHKVVPETTL